MLLSEFTNQDIQRSPYRRIGYYIIGLVAIVGVVYLATDLQSQSLAWKPKIHHGDDLAPAWRAWKAKYKRIFSTSEDAYRFGIFKDNYERIHKHNSNSSNKFTLAVNEFADLSQKEFTALYTRISFNSRGPNPTPAPKCPTPTSLLSKNINVSALPKTVDWRTKGAVTPVKNQNLCGSCWAFATVGSLEGFYALRKGPIANLSAQQLVDCADKKYGNSGCDGGYIQNALHYTVDAGIVTETEYPYTGRVQSCKRTGTPKVTHRGCENVPLRDVDALKAAVAKGPVAAYVEADHSSFAYYGGGIIDSPYCFKNNDVNHVIVVVGYTEDAWICKNSWGPYWGEKGYVYISTKLGSGSNGICGILSQEAAYPV